MRIFIFLATILLISSCKKDPACEKYPLTTDCGSLLKDCQVAMASDTTGAYFKITGTWQWQGSISYSWVSGFKKYCDIEQKTILVFDSTKNVKKYINGVLDCSTGFSIDHSGRLYLSSGCVNGNLVVCDQYLTIKQSDLDGPDNYYRRIK